MTREPSTSAAAVASLRQEDVVRSLLPVARMALGVAERMGVVEDDVPFLALERVSDYVSSGADRFDASGLDMRRPPSGAAPMFGRGRATAPRAVWAWSYLCVRCLLALASGRGGGRRGGGSPPPDEAYRLVLYAFSAVVAAGEREAAAEAMISSAIVAAARRPRPPRQPPRRRNPPSRPAHSMNLIHSVGRTASVRVMLPVAELAVAAVDRAVGMTDDRPQLVIDTLRRFVAGGVTRAAAQRELDALRLGSGAPALEFGGDPSAQAPYFAYESARHLAEVFRRSSKASDDHRLLNERTWTRLGAVTALERLGESEDSAEAMVYDAVEAAVGGGGGAK